MRVFILAMSLALLAASATAEPRRSRKAHVESTAVNKTETQRQGKVFSLFNVVQFENSPCASTSSISSGGSGSNRRNGTCLTESECRDKSGTASGNCAAGFGVCCVFFVDESGDEINQNCTYVRNPNFPSSYGETNNVQYTVNKCDDTVCGLRLDFETFSILGTGNTEEWDADRSTTVGGGACLDTFTVTSNAGDPIPVICGMNTGQHMYIDMGRGNGDSSSLQFTFDNMAGNRQWEIKVTQVKCGDQNAPDGCLQYHTGLTGRFTTFNFLPTNDNHLAEQDYSICIRQEEGFCCIQYQVCDDTNAMSLNIGPEATPGTMAGVDTQCTSDYIGIESSNSQCYTPGGMDTPTHNRYCGVELSATSMVEGTEPICDCTAPFMVYIHTDNLDDAEAMAENTVSHSRGTCLTWMQIPC